MLRPIQAPFTNVRLFADEGKIGNRMQGLTTVADGYVLARVPGVDNLLRIKPGRPLGGGD